MSPVRQPSIYASGEYSERNPGYHTDDSPWKAEQILRMLAKQKIEPATIAEIGCGAGEILVALQSALPTSMLFSGYEISPQAFELCKANQNERLRFYHRDFTDGAGPRPDLLLCIDVFEHVEDYMGFLRRVSALADQFIFHIPLEISMLTMLRSRPFIASRDKVGHLHYFTRDTALATLEDTGFDVLDCFYTPARIARSKTLAARMLAWPRRLSLSLNEDIAARVLGGVSLLVLAKPK